MISLAICEFTLFMNSLRFTRNHAHPPVEMTWIVGERRMVKGF